MNLLSLNILLIVFYIGIFVEKISCTIINSKRPQRQETKSEKQIIQQVSVISQHYGPNWIVAANIVGEQGASGFISFQQEHVVIVAINVTGLPPGKHAVHVHAYGDLKEGCKSTGKHVKRHLIGNVEAKDDGTAAVTFENPFIFLYGPDGIVGRSIVIHEKIIPYDQFPDINSPPFTQIVTEYQPFREEEELVGEAIACGIVTITNNNLT